MMLFGTFAPSAALASASAAASATTHQALTHRAEAEAEAGKQTEPHGSSTQVEQRK